MGVDPPPPPAHPVVPGGPAALQGPLGGDDPGSLDPAEPATLGVPGPYRLVDPSRHLIGQCSKICPRLIGSFSLTGP